MSGEARNHEAEVEAVAWALQDIARWAEYGYQDLDSGGVLSCVKARAWEALEALDAVRRSPQGECETCGGSGDRNGNLRAADPFGRCPACDGTGRRSPQGEDHETLRVHADALAAWVETLCEQVTSTPALMEVGRYRSYLSRCPSPERNTEKEDAKAYHRVCNALWPYWSQQESMPADEAIRKLLAERNTEKLVERIASWLQHIDRLDEIPGAKAAMPKYNPLWDAAEAIRAEFSSTTNKAGRDPGRAD
jgi:hypothetical protein